MQRRSQFDANRRGIGIEHFAHCLGQAAWQRVTLSLQELRLGPEQLQRGTFPAEAHSPGRDPPGSGSRRTNADARSIWSCADCLKSAFAGWTTIRYSDGLRNCNKVLLSRIRLAGSPFSVVSVSRSASRNSGMPSARKPCFVRSQNDCRAPAARKRALSVPVSLRFSQLMAQMCSSGAQSQSLPVLRAHAVTVLRNFAGDPARLGKCGDHIAHQLRFADASRVAADYDHSPVLFARRHLVA